MNFNHFLLILVFTLACPFSSFADQFDDRGKNGKFVVVLDAGHGGHDPGNLGNGYLEKNISLNIVLNIGAILERDPNIQVIYTRKDDSFVDLFVRGEIANKANADLFVSVHCDSHTSKAFGAGTFVLGLHANKQNFEIAKKENSVIYLEDNYQQRYAEYDINSPESIIGLTIMQEEFLDQSIALAKGIQDNFSNKLKRNDRQVKQAGFIVLHQTFMPSVLVETGFLTNDEEGAYLNSGTGQSEMGKAIADAIMVYKSSVMPGPALANEPLTPVVPAAKKEIDKPEQQVTKKSEVETKPAEEMSKPSEMEAKSEEPSKTAVLEQENRTQGEPEKRSGKELAIIKEETTIALVKEPSIAIKEAEPKTTVSAEKKSVNIVFKVQLLASARDLDLRSDNFKGLNRLSRESYKNLFRYMYGNTSSYDEALLLKSNADAKGYPSSFIVAYKDGERIPVPDALKYVSQ